MTTAGAKPQGVPTVTVLTVSFNALADLKCTVASVVLAGETGIEHVVVDGASSDGTPEYLAQTGTRWISEPDKGIADAMTKGLAMVSGEYVLILQAGDLFAPGLNLDEIQSELDGSDIVSFDVLITHPDGDVRFCSRGLSRALETSMSVPHQGAFVRRDLYERIGAFEAQYKVGMDYEFMLRAKRAGATCKVVNRVVAIMPADGISARRDWHSLKTRLAESRLIQSAHARGFADRLLQKLYWAVYPLYKRFRHRGGRR